MWSLHQQDRQEGTICYRPVKLNAYNDIVNDGSQRSYLISNGIHGQASAAVKVDSNCFIRVSHETPDLPGIALKNHAIFEYFGQRESPRSGEKTS